MQTYTYAISTSCPNGIVNTTKLETAIQNSSISTGTIIDINTNGDWMNIDFTTALNGGDQNILTALVQTTDSTPFSNAIYTLLGQRRGLLLNTTADQPIFVVSDRYIIRKMTVQNIAGGLAGLAAGGIYTGTNKTGRILVAAAQLYSGLADNTRFVDLTLSSGNQNTVWTANEIYFSLTIAIGTGVSMDIAIWGEDYSSDYGG